MVECTKKATFWGRWYSVSLSVLLSQCVLIYVLFKFKKFNLCLTKIENSRIQTSKATVHNGGAKAEDGQVCDDFPTEWKRDAERSFKYFRTHHTPSKEALDDALQSVKHGYLLRKEGSKLYRKKPFPITGGDPEHDLCQFVHLMCSNSILGDMDWVYIYGDNPLSKEFPSFSWTKSVHDLDILLPYQHSFRNMDKTGCNRTLPDFETWNHEKKNIAIWRGSTTGMGGGNVAAIGRSASGQSLCCIARSTRTSAMLDSFHTYRVRKISAR